MCYLTFAYTHLSLDKRLPSSDVLAFASVQISGQDICVSLLYRVRLHHKGRLVGQLLLLLYVVTHKAQLLLHHPNRLEVCCLVEGVAPQQQQLAMWEENRSTNNTPVQHLPRLFRMNSAKRSKFKGSRQLGQSKP